MIELRVTDGFRELWVEHHDQELQLGIATFTEGRRDPKVVYVVLNAAQAEEIGQHIALWGFAEAEKKRLPCPDEGCTGHLDPLKVQDDRTQPAENRWACSVCGAVFESFDPT